MFKKTKGHPQVEEMVAFLGKGSDFKGVLSFEGTIRVDGKIEGDIITKDTLIVGESAEINGNINVGTIITSGRINGNINASKKAQFVAPGAFTGDLNTPALQLDEGFNFNGKCDMKNTDKIVGQIEPKKEAVLAAS